MPSKRELNRNIKRLLIIKSAEDISQNKPYNEITMDEIAEKSKITKKTMYSYFPSKLSLFINIYEIYLQQLHERMFQVVSLNLSTQKKLKQLFTTLFEFTRENEKLMRLFWSLESDDAGGAVPIELSNRINIWNKAIVDEMAKLIREGITDKAIKNYDPEMVFHMFSAVNKGIFIHTNKEKKFNVADINAQHLFDFYCKIIFKEIFKKLE